MTLSTFVGWPVVRGLLTAGAGTWQLVSSQFVERREYSARNFPDLWLLRAHLIALALICAGVMSLILALVIPIRPYYIPNVFSWHLGILSFTWLFILYWFFAYYRVLSPQLCPPTIREPLVIALIACAILVVLPTYMFVYITKYRIVNKFPDVSHEEQIGHFFQPLAADAGDLQGPLNTLIKAEPIHRK